MIRYAIIAAAALALAACTAANTEDIGTRIDGEKSVTPPGANSFRVVFDPENPGIPKSAYVTSAKDEENVQLRISYPDGTTWEYTADSSIGSKQTAAIVATQEVVAALQAETGQTIGPDIVQAVSASVRAALGLPQ